MFVPGSSLKGVAITEYVIPFSCTRLFQSNILRISHSSVSSLPQVFNNLASHLIRGFPLTPKASSILFLILFVNSSPIPSKWPYCLRPLYGTCTSSCPTLFSAHKQYFLILSTVTWFYNSITMSSFWTTCHAYKTQPHIKVDVMVDTHSNRHFKFFSATSVLLLQFRPILL